MQYLNTVDILFSTKCYEIIIESMPTPRFQDIGLLNRFMERLVKEKITVSKVFSKHAD